jgi:hypothetical protein
VGRRFGVAAVVAVGLAVAARAGAVTSADVGYTKAQAFSAALRYLRVDLDYPVTERDPDAAYLLFTARPPEGSRESARGAIEVVGLERGIRVTVTLKNAPSYYEEVLKRGLLTKLRAEFGDAEVARRPEPEPPAASKKPDAPAAPSEPPAAAP